LADGDYEVTASATDIAGNVSQTDFPIIVTIDTVSPPATPIDLAATSDTGVKGDRETGAARVTLVGTTNGANVLTSRVVDLAGNIGPSTQTTITRVVETGGIDPVLLWNNAPWTQFDSTHVCPSSFAPIDLDRRLHSRLHHLGYPTFSDRSRVSMLQPKKRDAVESMAVSISNSPIETDRLQAKLWQRRC
jgi:hypothetical protein